SRTGYRRAAASLPAHGGFGTGGGSVSAVVVTSARMREKAVFIGSISVWDTIGTLAAIRIEIVMLFPPVVRRVMGRKAPRKRLACRVMCTPHGCSAEHPNDSRRSAHPQFG